MEDRLENNRFLWHLVEYEMVPSDLLQQVLVKKFNHQYTPHKRFYGGWFGKASFFVTSCRIWVRYPWILSCRGWI